MFLLFVVICIIREFIVRFFLIVTLYICWVNIGVLLLISVIEILIIRVSDFGGFLLFSVFIYIVYLFISFLFSVRISFRLRLEVLLSLGIMFKVKILELGVIL